MKIRKKIFKRSLTESYINREKNGLNNSASAIFPDSKRIIINFVKRIVIKTNPKLLDKSYDNINELKSNQKKKMAK